MKKLLSILAVFIIIGFTAQAKPVNPPAGFGIFFSALNPHGQWIELDYGLVVWRPTVIRRGWAPYRAGQWVWTYDGWYWDSYEPYGHVVYHYGRWFYDDYYGWIWIPDYEWAPAWVEWRYDDAYIGWAPLPPYAAFSISIGIHYTYDYYTPYHHWHFVQYRYFNEPYVYKHFVGPKYKNRIWSKTKYRTNYAYNDGRVVNRGVDVDYVRQRSGRNIRTRDIERVRDFSTFERDRGGNDRGDRNEKIRTLYIPKDELQRDRDRDRELIMKDAKRSDRKTNLDITRVELGDRRNNRSEEKIDRNRTNEREVVGGRDTKSERTPVDVKRETRNQDQKTAPPVRREVRTEEKKNERTPADMNRNTRNVPEVRERRNEEVNNVRKNETREMREVQVPQNRTDRDVRTEQRQQEKVRTNSDVNVRQNRQVEKPRTETNVQRDNRNNQKPEVRREVQRTEPRTDNRVERQNTGNDRSKQEKRRER